MIQVMDISRFLPLNPRDLLILSVLADDPLHGYGIMKAVEARSASGVFLDPANLYRSLRRMRRDEWIREAGDDSERRTTYALTATGRGVLDAELHRLERLLAHARPHTA